jgi:hypothetical protein
MVIDSEVERVAAARYPRHVRGRIDAKAFLTVRFIGEVLRKHLGRSLWVYVRNRIDYRRLA